MVSARKYRIGSKVFHLNKDLWIDCKKNNVSEKDIEREWTRFYSVGINVKQEVAAAAALRAKKSRGDYF